MQRIKFPDPLAFGILFHSRACQVQCQLAAQTRIGLLELPGACLDSGILTEMISAAIVKLCNPFFHTHRGVRKIHAQGTDAFDQHELLHFFWKGAGIEKRDRAAHGVTHEFEPLDSKRADHAIQIENVIGEMVITPRTHPATVAVSTTVRRDNPQSLFNLILDRSHKRLPTARLIQKAVD